MAKRAFLLSLVAFAFAYGLAVGAYRIFPFRQIDFAVDAVQLVWNERGSLSGTMPDHFLRAARHPGSGVTHVDIGRAAPGLTLLVGFFETGNELRLVQLDGTVVHRWEVRYSDYFPEPTHIAPSNRIPATDWNVDLHGAMALTDGSVVFNFEYAGMVRLDRCGKPAWVLERMTHHSIDSAADGGFWVSGRRRVASGNQFAPMEAPYDEDLVLEVSPEGDVVAEFSVAEIMANSGLLSLLAAGRPSFEGPTQLNHLNDIEELPRGVADAFPLFEAGDLLLSLRNMNLVAVVDPVARRIKWHRTGPWIRQHDPDFLDDGTISVFDNRPDGTETGSIMGGSRIVVVDPVDGTERTAYGGGMYTAVRGKHQRLPNGNLLLTESTAGRAFEVDPDGEVVWEYVNRYDEDNIAFITEATRYSPGYFEVPDWTCTQESDAVRR